MSEPVEHAEMKTDNYTPDVQMEREPVTPIVTQCEADITIKQEQPEDVLEGLQSSHDNLVNLCHNNCDGVDSAVPSFPGMLVSPVPVIKREVWAEEPVCSRSKFERFAAEITTAGDEANTPDNSWQIYKDGKPIGHIVDDINPGQSDWGTNWDCQSNPTTVQPGQSPLNDNLADTYITADKPSMCSEPGSRLHTKPNAKRHTTSKRGDKPFECSVCSYVCTSRYQLTEHRRTHTGEKPFECSVCEYTCTTQNILHKHMRTHTGEKPFKCPTCEYSSVRQYALTAHMRSHTGEKPYKCSVCEYECASSCNLNRHRRTHTGEKPFKCSVCKYESTTSSTMNTHMKSHTGEKPLKCLMCKYRCASHNSMDRHMRTHTGEKPFKCSQCEYKCADRGNLNKHVRTHNKQVGANRNSSVPVFQYPASI